MGGREVCLHPKYGSSAIAPITMDACEPIPIHFRMDLVLNLDL